MVVPSLIRLWFKLGSLSNSDHRTEGASPAFGASGTAKTEGHRRARSVRRLAHKSAHHVATLPASALFFTSASGCRLPVWGPCDAVAPPALPSALSALLDARTAQPLCLRHRRLGVPTVREKL